jgi:hypothetical protein
MTMLRPGPEVTRLIDRIKRLVAAPQSLDEAKDSEALEASRREIARLQLRLAAVVKHELALEDSSTSAGGTYPRPR